TLAAANLVDVGGRRLAARDVVIATGSRTAVPPVDGLEEHGYLDHVSFLDRDDFPRSLLILGGGPIGVEFAQMFRRFGCDVVDEVFVASGRRGNTEGLGLEALGVKMNKSYVAVDKYLQTSVPRVWACGDVHGGLQFTHVAAYEAVKLVRNILFPGKSAVDYEHVPWALYTDPEVGHI